MNKPVERRAVPKLPFGPIVPAPGTLAPVAITGYVLLGMIMVIGAYTLYGIFTHRPFDWTQFGIWAVVLELFNIMFLFAIWKYRARISLRSQVFLLDWAATSIWFWSLGPFYQLLTLNLNSQQLQLDAFSFFWEVPVFGCTSFFFRPAVFATGGEVRYYRQHH